MEHALSIYITENSLCNKRDKILLAVSGGIDSMVLMHLFHELGFSIGVGHCNFQMRGEASDEDAHFLAEKAAEYQFPFHTTSFDTKDYAKQHKQGIQEAARYLRYTWFSTIMETHGYHLLAVAHHQDDQIETVFLNMMRGAGIFGLQGMKPKRDHIIRPLLFATKEEIKDYANRHQIASREDTSNLESIYRRNYLRNKLIPGIEARIPSFRRRMSENILVWQKSARLLSGLLNQELELRRKTEGDHIILDTDKIEESLRDLVVFEWLRVYGFNYTQVTQMIEAIENNHSGRLFFSEKNRITTDRKKLILATKSTEEIQEIAIQKDDKIVNLEHGKLEFLLMSHLVDHFSDSESIAYLDAQKIEYPIKLRKWKAGDLFYPLGMEGKSQKIKKFFSNLKLHHFEKENQWMLVSNDQICWVVGRRIDDRFKIDDSTKYVLRVTWSPI
ncbi:MAG: tRNA lysidine(34) synthetase TilS [Saprospiraceae bacterium]|nr:tRNA lysidine(34) synthetase TilS [Saprospiraceae bacterium]